MLILIFSVQKTFSQKEIRKVSKNPKSLTEAVNSDKNKIYNSIEIEVKPKFPGGTEKFHQFIDKNYKNQTSNQLCKDSYLPILLLKKTDL